MIKVRSVAQLNPYMLNREVIKKRSTTIAKESPIKSVVLGSSQKSASNLPSLPPS